MPSTAAAAHALLDSPPSYAAICSKLCASMFDDLDVIREGIQAGDGQPRLTYPEYGTHINDSQLYALFDHDNRQKQHNSSTIFCSDMLQSNFPYTHPSVKFRSHADF